MLRSTRIPAALAALLIVTACGGSDGTVVDPGPVLVAEITVGPSPLAFGDVNLGDQGALDVTLANTGTAALEVTAVTLTGSPDYALGAGAPALPLSLAPGSSDVLPVVFTPTAAGLLEAELEVLSNAASLPRVVVPVSGTGVLATPAILVSPDPLVFGDVTVGDQLSLAVTIANSGLAPLSVTAVTLAGSADFALDPSLPAMPMTIAAGTSVDVAVVFTPSAAALAETDLTIESSDLVAPSVVVHGSGTGNAPPVVRQSFTMLRLGGGPRHLYEFDLTAMTYRWKDALTDTLLGSGTLTPLVGTQDIYELSEDASTLILDRDRMAIRGDGTSVLAVGFPPPTYSATDLAGMYNYVRVQPGPPYAVTIGTLEIEAAGAWRLWEDGNGTTLGPTLAALAGEWIENADGSLLLRLPAGSPPGWLGANLVIRPDGDETAFVMTENVGDRLWLGVRQRPVPPGIDGTYDAFGYDPGAKHGDGLHAIDVSGTTVTFPAGSDTMVPNAPWTGFAMSIAVDAGALSWEYYLFGAADLAFGVGEWTHPTSPDEGWIWAALK